MGADQTGGEGELEAQEAKRGRRLLFTRRRVWLGLPLYMEAQCSSPFIDSANIESQLYATYRDVVLRRLKGKSFL